VRETDMATNWFDEDFPPKQALDAVSAAFDKPGAHTPAAKGTVDAAMVLVTAIAGRVQKRVLAIIEDLELRLSDVQAKADTIEAKADKIANLERRFKTFDPLVYDGRECGKRSITMRLNDGRRVVVTTEVSSGSERPAGEPPIVDTSRVDRLEQSTRELASLVRFTQKQLTAARKRIAVLERAKDRNERMGAS
jgi:hypothetical protein